MKCLLNNTGSLINYNYANYKKNMDLLNIIKKLKQVQLTVLQAVHSLYSTLL